MSKFSKTLSAAAVAFAAVLTAGAAIAGDCAQGHCGAKHAGYHGRSAGQTGVSGPSVKVHGVNVYAGVGTAAPAGAIAAARTAAGVTVYAGGGAYYVNYTKVPEYLDGLEVVTVTRGAGSRGRLVDAVCVSREGHEMPAARIRRASRVPASVNMELFRCEAGFALTGFVSRAGGSADGYEVACEPGLSLWSGKDDAVHCRKKQPLGWSEAKLRHAFGIGAITIAGHARADHASVTVTRGLSLTGGVGHPPL